jgi:ketosteroid isomerase-like protein
MPNRDCALAINTDVRVYGNVAVMTNHTTIRGADNGKPSGGISRYLRIFVKEQRRWRAVPEQATTPFKVDSTTPK